MKLTFAVLALLCLSSAVSASSNAADFKLPLAGLLNGNFSHGLAEANLTIPGDYQQAAQAIPFRLRTHAMRVATGWLQQALAAGGSSGSTNSSSSSSSHQQQQQQQQPPAHLGSTTLAC
jgi:hypothetical protein